MKDEADGETAVAEQKQLCGWGAVGCEQSPSNAQGSEVPVTEVGRGQGWIKKERASGKSVQELDFLVPLSQPYSRTASPLPDFQFPLPGDQEMRVHSPETQNLEGF